MTQCVRREPSPRDVGSAMVRDYHRNKLEVNLGSLLENGDTEKLVSAGLPGTRRLGKSASGPGVAVIPQNLLVNSSVAIS